MIKKEKERRTISDVNLSGAGDLPSSIPKVLERCCLMQYLCKKALDTGYLPCFERQTYCMYTGIWTEKKEFCPSGHGLYSE